MTCFLYYSLFVRARRSKHHLVIICMKDSFPLGRHIEPTELSQTRFHLLSAMSLIRGYCKVLVRRLNLSCNLRCHAKYDNCYILAYGTKARMTNFSSNPTVLWKMTQWHSYAVVVGRVTIRVYKAHLSAGWWLQ